MAVQSPIVTSAATESGRVQNTLLTAMVEHIPYVMLPTEVLGDLDQSAGRIYQVVISSATGYVYFYDSTDSTTPDDGLTCLVDFNGHRYHLPSSDEISISSVLAQQNSPSVSPVEGDAYIVGNSPTGAWVGHAKDVALWTRRGWVFARPEIGMTVYNKALSTNLQYNQAGAWVGFAPALNDGSIAPKKLLFPLGVPVEAQQNAPPGGPTANVYYLVGTSPTGAWAGQANAVTWWDGSAWQFIPAYEGAAVYNRATDIVLYFNGTTWVGNSSSNIQVFASTAGGTWTKPAIGVMAFIEVWGAGGSGGRSGSDGGGGGGGGAYICGYIPLSDLPSTVAVTVGAGGPLRTTSGAGTAGGSSSFGALLVAYGGGGGSGAGSGAGGGGGGGQGSVGATPTTITGGSGGADYAGRAYAVSPDYAGGDGGAGLNTTSTAPSGSGSTFGGGGGGGGNGNGGGGAGGNSVYGGAGGGGARSENGSNGPGGLSVIGGNGGAAGRAANATPGAQPGGGGGGAEGVNTGKGGDGMVRVTVF